MKSFLETETFGILTSSFSQIHDVWWLLFNLTLTYFGSGCRPIIFPVSLASGLFIMSKPSLSANFSTLIECAGMCTHSFFGTYTTSLAGRNNKGGIVFWEKSDSCVGHGIRVASSVHMHYYSLWHTKSERLHFRN